MTHPRAHTVMCGEDGYATRLHELLRLGGIDREELLRRLREHGDVMRSVQPPLDDGTTFNMEAFRALAGELGGRLG